MVSSSPLPHLVILDRNNLRAPCASGTLPPMKTCLSTATLPLRWEIESSGHTMVSISPSSYTLTLEDRLRAPCRRAQRRSGSGMRSPTQRCLSTPPPTLILILRLHIQTGRPMGSISPSPHLHLLTLEDRLR